MKIIIRNLCILVLIFILVILIGCNEKKQTPIHNEYRFNDISKIKDIDLDIKSGELIIEASEINEITVVCEENERDYFDVKVIDDELKVEQRHELFSFRYFNSSDISLKLFIPITLITDLSIDLTSGVCIVGEELKFNDVDIDVSSGRVQLVGINVEDLNVEIKSGKTTIQKTNVNSECKLESSSGKIIVEESSFNCFVEVINRSGETSLKNCNFKNSLKLKNSSGKTSVEDSNIYNVEVKSSSGMILISPSNNDVEKIYLVNKSGSSIIKLNENIKGFQAHTKISSGIYINDFSPNNSDYYGDGSIMIEANISSGILRIGKK